MIHKRMNATGLCESRAWTLCEPEKFFEGPSKSYRNPEFIEWTKKNTNRWADVTCPKCLARRRPK